MTDAWVRFSGGEGARALDAEAPFVIGVIADLSARSGRAAVSQRARGFVPVDRDELDALFASCAPRVELALPDSAPFVLELASLDDLHPDRLVERVPALAALLRAREAAHDVRELRRRLAAAGIALDEAKPERALPRGGAQQEASGRALLDEMLGRSPGESAAASVGREDPVAVLVRAIGERASDGVDPAAAAARREAVDRELTRRLRAVLADVRFRELEASWRALRDLTRAAETGDALQLRVLDATREDLAGGALLESALDGLLRSDDPPRGGARALVVVDVPFDGTPDDFTLMARLADAGRHVGARVVANASPELLDAAAHGDLLSHADWRAARERCGDVLRLAGPRVLARLPYGAGSAPIEAFPFEELGPYADAEAGCWSGAAMLVARAFAACASATGALARLGEFSQIDGLPQCIARAGAVIGPAERVLDLSEREQLARSGLITVSGAPGSDAVRLALGGVG